FLSCRNLLVQVNLHVLVALLELRFEALFAAICDCCRGSSTALAGIRHRPDFRMAVDRYWLRLLCLHVRGTSSPKQTMSSGLCSSSRTHTRRLVSAILGVSCPSVRPKLRRWNQMIGRLPRAAGGLTFVVRHERAVQGSRALVL